MSKKRPQFISEKLTGNPDNPLDRIQDLRRRVEDLERLLMSSEAADTRYAQLDKSAFHVHKGGTDQSSVGSGTWTKVTWSTELFDRGGEFDLSNERFIPNEEGEYLFGATIKWTSFMDGSLSRLAIYRNGAAAWYGPLFHSGSGTAVGASVQVLVSLDAGDTIELYAYQNTSIGTRAIEGDATETYFWGTRVQ